MNEFQLIGMQRLPADDAVIRMIKVVTRKGITQVFHVYPDLVGPACLQMKFYQGVGLG